MSDIEHDRQMSAIHQARSAMRSLSREERDAHKTYARHYEDSARRTLRKFDAAAETRAHAQAGLSTATAAVKLTEDERPANE